MARELGGGRWEQLFAACAMAPVVILTGKLMQYVSFDHLAWVAARGRLGARGKRMLS